MSEGLDMLVEAQNVINDTFGQSVTFRGIVRQWCIKSLVDAVPDSTSLFESGTQIGYFPIRQLDSMPTRDEVVTLSNGSKLRITSVTTGNQDYIVAMVNYKANV